MNIAVIGTGYVGLVTGTCLAEIGHSVICVDNNPIIIDKLNNNIMPIYEPGLEELVKRNKQANRLTFTTDIDSAIRDSLVIFSAVGTPPDPSADHRADLTAVKQVAQKIGQNLNNYKVIVTKSTVPVGTGDLVAEIIKSSTDQSFAVVSNPEFLREGNAIGDFMKPDRIVVGTDNDEAAAIMKDLYAPISDDEHPLIITDLRSAEVIKYAANSFLATKISFINEIANFCEQVGADIQEVAKGIGLDKRIGRQFLNAGIGYGGSCFPKDVKALIQTGLENSHEFHLLNAVEKVNDLQKEKLLEKLFNVHPDVSDKIISIWGLSFKPNTDDIREAPSIIIIDKLLKKNAKINAFDPISGPLVHERFNFHPSLNITSNLYDALQDSSALLILTGWEEFKNPDFPRIKKLMKEPHIFDGRNIHHPQIAHEHKINYYSIGRQNVRHDQ